MMSAKLHCQQAYSFIYSVYFPISLGRDLRFFALNEMNLSIFDGDSSNEEEKSKNLGD